MRNLKKSTERTRVNAAKNEKVTGMAKYKAALLDELVNVSDRALSRAKTEIPKKRNVKLSEMRFAEFEDLPKDLQRRLKAESDALVESQAADMEKAVVFQFRSSMDQPDEFVERDLRETVKSQAQSPSVNAASGNSTARVINEARTAFFFTDEVLKDVYAFQFRNPDPVSAICQNLKGRIFDKDDPASDQYFPPLHHNCKSYITPVLVDQRSKPDISPYGLQPIGDEKTVERALKSITLSSKKE
jgi:SPP1 gp7 family putative phage head morphogenesis protein